SRHSGACAIFQMQSLNDSSRLQLLVFSGAIFEADLWIELGNGYVQAVIGEAWYLDRASEPQAAQEIEGPVLLQNRRKIACVHRLGERIVRLVELITLGHLQDRSRFLFKFAQFPYCFDGHVLACAYLLL